MPFQLTWLIENRVLLENATGEMDIPALHQSAHQTRKCLQHGTEPVHIIIDCSHLTKFPRSVQQYYDAKKLIPREKLGCVILVSNDRLLQHVTTTVTRLIGFKLHLCTDMSAAIDYLKQIDASIKWNEATSSC